MLAKGTFAVTSGKFHKELRPQAMHRGFSPTAATGRRKTASILAQSTTGGGGRGGCNQGPRAGKSTDEDEHSRPGKNKALLAKPYNDFLELLGPIALAFGCYKLSCNVRTIGQGPDRCGPPLTEVLSRFVDTAEHATVKRKETRMWFSFILLAFALGAGACETKDSTSPAVGKFASGLACSSIVVLISALRCKDG